MRVTPHTCGHPTCLPSRALPHLYIQIHTISHHTEIGMSLTKTEFNKRMLELRNLRKLYEDQRIQNVKLRAENKELKLKVQDLTKTVNELMERLAKLELRNEELLTMAFGKSGRRKTIMILPILPPHQRYEPRTPILDRSHHFQMLPKPNSIRCQPARVDKTLSRQERKSTSSKISCFLKST